MIELKFKCLACQKQTDQGEIELDLMNGEMNVECGWCHARWKLEARVIEAPMPESRRDYMPHWKQKVLGLI